MSISPDASSPLPLIFPGQTSFNDYTIITTILPFQPSAVIV